MDRTDDVNVENFFEKFSKSLRVRLSFSCIISVSLAVFSYHKPNPYPLIPSYFFILKALSCTVRSSLHMALSGRLFL